MLQRRNYSLLSLIKHKMKIQNLILLVVTMVFMCKNSFSQSVYKPANYLEITKSYDETEVFQVIFYSYDWKEKQFPHGSVGFFCFQKCFGNEQFQVFGFYPTENANKNVEWLYRIFPGFIKNDIDIQPDYGLAINISRGDFLDAIKVLNKNQVDKNLSYNAALSSCIKFMDDIATCIGLETPIQIGKTPNEYVKKLYDLNK